MSNTIKISLKKFCKNFFPGVYNRVLVNWPRAHCGVLQLTEASYLGPDSPRMSPRNETVKQCRRQMTVANSPVQLFTFGIFEHKWGTRKHIDDLKKYSWCIPVQKEIKPIIWGAAITPEPWNRQQCWFIFEDPKVRVARLSKRQWHHRPWAYWWHQYLLYCSTLPLFIGDMFRENLVILRY